MSELPIKVTLKAGAGFDAPWITVDAADPSDLKFKLDNFDGPVLQAVVDTANALKAANVIGAPDVPQAAPQAPAAPAQPSGWGKPAAQQAPAPQQQPGVVYHPVDVCGGCGSRVQEKVITSKSTGKTYELWTCPNQRAKGDGHYSEFKD